MKTNLRITLRELRERRKWSRVKCAMMLGVSARALRAWEKGERIPKPIVQACIEQFAKGSQN